MKRFISLILIIFTFVFVFASCGETQTDVEATVYETLNKIFTKDNSLVNIEVETVTNGKSLASLYTVAKEAKGEKITYSVEKLSTFEEIDGEYVIPDSYKTTLEGEVLVSNGSIIEQSGDSVDLDFETISVPDFEFDESNFSNVNNSNGAFTASVTNPSDFLGKAVSCSDMSVSVAYSETAVSEIVLSYTSAEGSNVTIKYSFN